MTWTVKQLHEALGDLIVRRPAAADHAVLLVDAIEHEHFYAGLTEVTPDFEMRATVLRASGEKPLNTRKRHDDTADTQDGTRRG